MKLYKKVSYFLLWKEIDFELLLDKISWLSCANKETIYNYCGITEFKANMIVRQWVGSEASHILEILLSVKSRLVIVIET